MNKIPENIEAGSEIEVQISPFGSFVNTDDEGEKRSQVCDRAALDAMVAAFDTPVLVDFDHASEDGESTEAAAWVESLRVDDELGLMGRFRFTDKGAEAAKFRRYRFISPVWNTDGEDRPIKLLRVGLTNRPQIPVKPLINSVRKHNPPEGVPETTKENPKMDKLKELLGLAADASDEDVLAAVTALKGEVEAAKAEKADAEAEAFANANCETEEEKEALKNAFKASAETAKALVNAFRKAKRAEGDIPKKPLVNSIGATPKLKAAKSASDVRAEMAALPPAERAAYFKAHASEF